MKVAQKTKQALLERYGSSLVVNGTLYRAFPEPFQLAVLDEGELLKLIRNERRTEYLVAAARAFSEVDSIWLW
jgi:3-methyladenine DNA glycosylase/8-oxoguanine DNA glycosylase